jgi:guanylate kinase
MASLGSGAKGRNGMAKAEEAGGRRRAQSGGRAWRQGNRIIMPVRVTCRDKRLDDEQVTERMSFIAPSARHAKASYTDRKQEVRILCGVVELLLPETKEISYAQHQAFRSLVWSLVRRERSSARRDQEIPPRVARQQTSPMSQPPTAKGEVHGEHFYFLPPALIASFQDNPNFATAMVRSDWQAVDLLQVEDLLSAENVDLVFAEVFHTFGDLLRIRLAGRQVKLSSIFLLPVPAGTPSKETIATMRQKLTRRGTDKEPKLTERAESAPAEMLSAINYTHRILNPATEDDTEEWGEFGTENGKSGSRNIQSINDLGLNARWLMETVIEILEGRIPPCPDDVPHWSK